ncbi:MAG: hypothetical protein WD733_24945 [Bryobacterales bacterium]
MSEIGALPAEQAATEAPLARVAGCLRVAVRTESYEEVPALLAEHNCVLQQALLEASADPVETKRLATQAREMLDWVKVSVLANRAHAQTSLNRLSHAARYMPAASPARTWKYQA